MATLTDAELAALLLRALRNTGYEVVGVGHHVVLSDGEYHATGMPGEELSAEELEILRPLLASRNLQR